MAIRHHSLCLPSAQKRRVFVAQLRGNFQDFLRTAILSLYVSQKRLSKVGFNVRRGSRRGLITSGAWL